MADQATSLPVRSESDGTDAKVVVKVIDGINGGTNQMSVDSDKNAHVELHANDPAGLDVVVNASEEGRLVDGFYHATNNTEPGSIGVVAHARAASPAYADSIKKLTAISNGSVHALDMSLHDEDGAAYSDANPVPVYVAPDPGTEVHNYDTQAALAAGAADNHDYAVASGVFELQQVMASASGKLKIEVQWTTDDVTYTTLYVGFNSTANPNIFEGMSRPYNLAGGANAKIRVIRTNKDNQAQDVYSTIIGILK